LSGRGAAFLGSRQFPQHLILPHGHPHTVSGLMPCLLVTNALATWRQAKVCLRPLPSYGEDRASRPPPLQHRVPILASRHAGSLQRLRSASALSGSLRGFFSHRSGHLWDPAQAPGLTRMVLFQPHGLQDVRMSLSTLFIVADVARQRFSGLIATPVSSRLTQSPLGAFHLPQALISVAPPSLRGGSFASSGEVELSSTLVDFRRISFVLTESQAMT
jgi:hypothetical protein